jgi:predicted MPP superfamily phosphohydrolase
MLVRVLFIALPQLASVAVTAVLARLYAWPLSVSIAVSWVFMASIWVYLGLFRWFRPTPWHVGLKWLSGVGLGSLSILVAVASMATVAQAVGVPVVVVQWGGAMASVGLIGGSLLLNKTAATVVTHSVAGYLPAGHAPIRVVQLTDIHFNGLKSVAWVQQLVDTVNRAKPDVVVFTGDFSDIPQRWIHDQCTALQGIQAPVKLAVSGNHDFYTGYADFCSCMQDLEFEVLDNRCRSVGDLCIAGLPDPAGQAWGMVRQKLSTVVPDSSPAVLLLDHRPEAFTQHVLQFPRLLQLSGHTHAGQLPPWGFLVWLRYRITAGWRRLGQARLYVSRGTSTWGPPMRLFKQGEVTLMLLSD